MPHRVANFFRSSTNSLEKRTVVTSSRRKESPSRVSRGSGSSERLACTSTIEVSADDARYAQRPKMGESRSTSSPAESHKEHAHHHHKISFPSMHFGRSSKDAHGSSPCALDWKLESPPIVLYGDAERSSGALVSGQLILNIKEDKVEITSFDATLGIHVTHKKPFANHCHECAHEVTELKKWQILPNPLTLTKGEHYFPFSVLLEGHLPATMDGPLCTIAYEFKSEVVTKSGNSSYSSRLEKVLDVKRSLAGSDVPHHSVRVFPPTNIKASGHYPHVIHPIGSFTLSLRLDGISQHNAKVGTIEYWRLKKLTWRLEETSKTVAPACIRHVPREIDGASQDQGQKKGMPRTETRTIGEKTMFSGWKSNYMSTTDSSIELELEYSLGKHAKYVCDTKSRDGTEVTHQLMVELVVSQEWAPINRPTLVTHTGVGRILRMHFGTVLTERAGIGISWDNEAPPIYQDVPPSPPAYSQATVEDSECSLDEMMEVLGLDSPVQAVQPQSPET